MSEYIVTGIFISSEKGRKGIPMQEVTSVQARPGGLEGDRYLAGIGAWSKVRETVRDISIIAQSAIDQANSEFDTDFQAIDTRRNILIDGISIDELNSLVGQLFTVGVVAMQGIELCDPCDRPSSLLDKKGFKDAYAGRGGIRAKILTEGNISIGNQIRTLTQKIHRNSKKT